MQQKLPTSTRNATEGGKSMQAIRAREYCDAAWRWLATSQQPPELELVGQNARLSNGLASDVRFGHETGQPYGVATSSAAVTGRSVTHSVTQRGAARTYRQQYQGVSVIRPLIDIQQSGACGAARAVQHEGGYPRFDREVSRFR